MKNSMASAYISNCGVTTYDRVKLVQSLKDQGVTVDLFGKCFENPKEEPEDLAHLHRDLRKRENIGRYHFYFAFENSMKDGYITEKYWQSLFVGTVPIVVGANNLHLFEPSPNSVIHWKNISDPFEISKRIKHLHKNEDEYKKMLNWKENGASDQFLSIIDHDCIISFCHWCHFIATKSISKKIEFQNFDLFVREFGRFKYTPINLNEFTIQGLKNSILENFQNYLPK
jgi:glycoprotein 3-alpha-L-fucosyltransferase